MYERQRAPIRRAESLRKSASASVETTSADASTPVAWFVDAMATELGLGASSADRRTRRQLWRLAAWATGEGIALDREVILDPDTVERFVEVGLDGDRSRASYRAVLRRVAPLLTTRAPWEPRPASLARRQVASPYTVDEIELLRTDTLDQPTAARRRAATALLVLGLGVGLDGRWATRVAARDVSSSAQGVAELVGEPAARTVVALANWEDELAELVATAGDEFLVGGHSISSRRTGHLTAGLVVPTGHPRLAPARLRSTWLVTHLRAGTRLPELCRAAGPQGVTVLSNLLEGVEPVGRRRHGGHVARQVVMSRAPIDTRDGRPTSVGELIIARQLVQRSGVVSVLAPLLDADVGRPRQLSLEALLAALQLNALHRHHQAHLVEAARVLNALTEDQRASMGITSWDPAETYAGVIGSSSRSVGFSNRQAPAWMPPGSPTNWPGPPFRRISLITSSVSGRYVRLV